MKKFKKLQKVSGLMMDNTTDIVSDRKAELVKELKKRMSDILKPHHTDEFLLRWLRVRNFDLKRTERLLRVCLRSRASYELDDLPQKMTEPEIALKYGFLGFLGFDKEGTPVRYVGVGRGDYDGFVRSVSTFDICIYCAYVFVKDVDAMRKVDGKNGKYREDEILAIFDMEGFNLQQIAYKHVLETGIDLMRMFQDYNPPEALKRLLIINAPIYFSVVFNMFKPILKMDFLQRLEVYSRDNSPAALQKYISPEIIPKFLGGERVDENGDPNCSAFIRYGGKVPASYYGVNKPRLSPSDPDVYDISLSARSIYDYPVEVPKAGMKIHIEFWTDDALYLHIVYKKLDSENGQNGFIINGETDRKYSKNDVRNHEEMVSPLAKIQSHIMPVDSYVHCERAGTYVFRFDSSCRWIYSTRIVHRIKPVAPTT